MKLIVKSIGKETRVFEKNYAKDFLYKDFEENHTEENLIDFMYKNQQILLNGVVVEYFEVFCKNEVALEIKSDIPLFKLHFELEGLFSYSPEAHPEITIEDGCYNFYYLPIERAVLYNKKESRKTLEIRFTEVYLRNLLGVNFSLVWKELNKAVEEKSAYILWENEKRITPELRDFIQKIMTCEYPPAIKKAYLEAKITELLMMVLAEYNKSLLTENCLGKLLAVKDFVVAKKAEKIINARLSNPPTIPDLALLVGVNATKLKKDFKEVYSKSIFQFITEQRMKKAAELLKEGMNVTQTAYEIGYKNPQHFTVAFKKYFGYLPKELSK